MRSGPSFARFIAIDWSGAQLLSAQRRAIVRCVVEGPARARRVTALGGGLGRRAIVDWLAERAGDGVPTLVGLDFPFSYATPFLDHEKVRSFRALLARMASLDDPAERAGEFAAFVARCGRWWARWGQHQDHRTRRVVERLPATWGAESPLRALPGRRGYDFVGRRQVGKAAITGLAAIGALKKLAPAIRVWPFEDPGGASLVLAEIWPRLALGRLVKRTRPARLSKVRELAGRGMALERRHRRAAAASEDAIDALAAAAEMALRCWGLTDRRALPPAAVREGWILGVAPPTRCSP